jgi:hypothetical protein
MYKNQELIDQVIEELKLDIANNDWTVIEELLSFVPVEFLKGLRLKNATQKLFARGASVMDKKELVDAVIEMIKQDTAAGDWEDVDRIMTCAFKAKLKLYTPDYEEKK